jgi:hypothetical protein
MANTYILIASNTLASAVSSITFSSIPATFTDLVLKVSYRTATGSGNTETSQLSFNGVSTTTYSHTRMNQDGATVTSNRGSNETYGIILAAGNTNTATANTFGNTEIYIPSYLVAQNKQHYAHFTAESNISNLSIGQTALLWRNTAAITSLTLASNSGNNYLVGSSFYLYGVKNS